MLSRVDTTVDFLRDLEKHLHLPENSCRLVPHIVHRESNNQDIQMDCLEIAASSAITCLNYARAILFAWMRYGKREFFRLSTERYIFLYDTDVQKGLFYDKETNKDEEVGELSLPSSEKWQITMSKFISTAKKADQSISLRVEEVKKQVKVSGK